jgi:lysyl endopeptidase
MKKQLLHFSVLFFSLILLSFYVEGQVKTRKFANGLPSNYLQKKIDQIPVYRVKPPEKFKESLQNPDRYNSKEFIYKYAIAKQIDLDFLKESKLVSDNEFNYYALKIEAEDALSVSIQFKESSLSLNSVLTIYTEFEITDSIVDKTLNNSTTWKTKAYHGNQLTLLLKVPIGEIQGNKLKVGLVSFGYRSVNSAFFGSPGASSSCHKNAICPEGGLYAQNRNSIALVEVDEGTYTGALIMNTCNTNTPYFLTAKHNLTGGGDPGSAVFIFKYLSAQCNTNTGFSAEIQFNGADVKASYDPSDFALFQLRQTPSANLGLSFSGWDRNFANGFSYASLHHPKGDLMKLSIDYNSLGLSSWGGTDTHLVAEFGYGAIEPGSSGGPLFNSSRRIVGQLHGNQATTGQFCTDLRGEYGRFDLSWNGGGTPQTALKYWLDPNNTNLLTTTTTDISSLIDVSSEPLMLGDNFICSGFTTYSISPLPSNASVTWTISNSSIASIPSPSNGSSVNLTKVGSGVVTLTANIVYCSGSTRAISKAIMVGASVSGYYTITSNYHSSGNQLTLYNNNSTIFLPANQGFGINAYLTSPGRTGNATWTRNANSYPFFWYQIGSSTLTFSGNSAPTAYQQRTGIFNLSVPTACGTFNGQFSWPIVTQGWSFRVASAPNPSTNILSVSLVDSENSSQKLATTSSSSISMDLSRFDNARQVKSWTFKGNSSEFNLDVSDLPNGTYVLRVSIDGTSKTSQIVIKR